MKKAELKEEIKKIFKQNEYKGQYQPLAVANIIADKIQQQTEFNEDGLRDMIQEEVDSQAIYEYKDLEKSDIMKGAVEQKVDSQVEYQGLKEDDLKKILDLANKFIAEKEMGGKEEIEIEKNFMNTQEVENEVDYQEKINKAKTELESNISQFLKGKELKEAANEADVISTANIQINIDVNDFINGSLKEENLKEKIKETLSFDVKNKIDGEEVEFVFEKAKEFAIAKQELQEYKQSIELEINQARAPIEQKAVLDGREALNETIQEMVNDSEKNRNKNEVINDLMGKIEGHIDNDKAETNLHTAVSQLVSKFYKENDITNKSLKNGARVEVFNKAKEFAIAKGKWQENEISQEVLEPEIKPVEMKLEDRISNEAKNPIANTKKDKLKKDINQVIEQGGDAGKWSLPFDTRKNIINLSNKFTAEKKTAEKNVNEAKAELKNAINLALNGKNLKDMGVASANIQVNQDVDNFINGSLKEENLKEKIIQSLNFGVKKGSKIGKKDKEVGFVVEKAKELVVAKQELQEYEQTIEPEIKSAKIQSKPDAKELEDRISNAIKSIVTKYEKEEAPEMVAKSLKNKIIRDIESREFDILKLEKDITKTIKSYHKENNIENEPMLHDQLNEVFAPAKALAIEKGKLGQHQMEIKLAEELLNKMDNNLKFEESRKSKSNSKSKKGAKGGAGVKEDIFKDFRTENGKIEVSSFENLQKISGSLSKKLNKKSTNYEIENINAIAILAKEKPTKEDPVILSSYRASIKAANKEYEKKELGNIKNTVNKIVKKAFGGKVFTVNSSGNNRTTPNAKSASKEQSQKGIGS